MWITATRRPFPPFLPAVSLHHKSIGILSSPAATKLPRFGFPPVLTYSVSEKHPGQALWSGTSEACCSRRRPRSRRARSSGPPDVAKTSWSGWPPATGEWCCCEVSWWMALRPLALWKLGDFGFDVEGFTKGWVSKGASKNASYYSWVEGSEGFVDPDLRTSMVWVTRPGWFACGGGGAAFSCSSPSCVPIEHAAHA